MFDAPSFAPSNARTADGKLIPVEQFFPAARCAACHQDTHSSWSNSLHRNAAREPFYRESADILLKTRGIELTRHCESCHTPVALFSGALTKTAPKVNRPLTPLDDEGISCSGFVIPLPKRAWMARAVTRFVARHYWPSRMARRALVILPMTRFWPIFLVTNGRSCASITEIARNLRDVPQSRCAARAQWLQAYSRVFDV